MSDVIKILGCAGSIDKNSHTTCIRINDNVLIDAGTGLLSLTIDELKTSNTSWLTNYMSK